MIAIAIFTAAGTALALRPVRRMFPSESVAAFVITGVAMLGLLAAGRAG
ncbi:MAG: hypothetical protein IT302_02645 [Dehalococcoidia bacterium]|nr:hypothetical protein [Dehalococcoidia bacterium]